MPSPRRQSHPIVKAAAVALVVGAAVVGVWAGSFGSPGRADDEQASAATAAQPRPEFLPASDSTPPTPDADRGADVFQQRCAGCHTIGGGDREGPDLARAAMRRDPVWVSAMIAKPDSM